MSKLPSRFSFPALAQQLTKIWRITALAIAISLGGTGGTILVARLTSNPVWYLTRDPAQIKEYSIYIGILANWCALLWIMTAVICLFSAAVLKRNNADGSAVKFLFVSGVFSLILGVDDLYMLHDRLLPKFFNIPEMFLYTLYFFAFAIYLAGFSSQILGYDYLLLGAALSLFVLSRAPHPQNFNAAADILKYSGIIFWLAFFYSVAWREMNALYQMKSQATMLPPPELP